MTDRPLSLAIELRPGSVAAGDAVLTNSNSGTVRVWRRGNSWGDPALSFVTRRGDGSAQTTLTLKAQVYTRNVPAVVEIDGGGAHRIAFDLCDGEWEPDLREATGTDGLQLAGVYEITPTPESEEHRVWTGRVQSAFVGLS